MVRKLPLALLPLLLLCAASAGADGELTTETDIRNTVIRSRTADSAQEPYWGWLTSGSAALSVKSSGNRNVKADLAFSFIFPEQAIMPGLSLPLLSLDRAYIKARFPEFRLTAGKTRLGWGDGFVFNSGDVIFGSTGFDVDLTASEVRTATKWLAAVNIPLGRFTFIEAVAVPPEMTANTELSTAGLPQIGNIENFSAGGRFYTKIAGIKAEAGYFFDNSAGELLHKPYAALQGNLIADWYIGGSADLAGTGDFEELFRESLNLSAGLFYMIQLSSISSLALRLEGLYKPFSAWSETAAAGGEAFSDYALLLYPEISYSPVDTLNLFTRAVFSPVDMSALLTAGGSWNVFEGFNLSFYAIVNTGDGDDIFSWNRDKDLWRSGTDIIDNAAFSLGINYIY